MRILYIDCDSLRADHLSCYGYHRDTTPNIDEVAATGMRFTNYYASDAPCLPSRTALFTGRFGIHTGVVGHGKTNADPRQAGERRDFGGRAGFETWPSAMQGAGYETVLVSPFPARHGAYHVLDGFSQWFDTGENGHETADEVFAVASSWLDGHATDDDWYLHVNFWDPHTPYRTPLEFGDPFEESETPNWLTDDRIESQRDAPGPFSARDLYFYWNGVGDHQPEAVKARMPDEIRDRSDFARFVEGYDTGVRYMDEYIGRLLDRLRELGVYEETLVIVSADHGESLGERNVYGDHVTADEQTANLPLVVAGPEIEVGVDDVLRYHVDLPPTVLDLLGGESCDRWDGRSFAAALTGDDEDAGTRQALVTSTGAWTAQRSIRWDEYLLVRTFHDAYKHLPPVVLFDVESDPHLTTDLAPSNSEVVDEGLRLLESWRSERLMDAVRDRAGGNSDAANVPTDPLWEVLHDGGPFHSSGGLDRYLDRLRETGRSDHADALAETRGFVPQAFHRERHSTGRR